MKLFDIAVSALFPSTCVVCNEIIEDGDYFCAICDEYLKHCMSDKICTKCGLPKSKCDCKRNAFHFNGCIAPFYNDTSARTAMYAFKFRKKEYIANFFAEQMALFVKQCYNDIKFDVIVYVPLFKLRQLWRGYNQSFLLAKRISEILQIPVKENALGCRFRRRTQHSTKLKHRFENVKDKYYCKCSMNGKTVLLIDDIKTTGATLDECTKQLMLSGADRVYCLTGLITDKKKG